jgi:hypothetical protein
MTGRVSLRHPVQYQAYGTYSGRVPESFTASFMSLTRLHIKSNVDDWDLVPAPGEDADKQARRAL